MSSIQIRRMQPSQVALPLVMAVCLMGSLCRAGQGAEPPQAGDPGGRAAVVVELSAIERAYADVKLAFDLAGDGPGYTILKDTVDLFLGGVDRRKPCEYRIFATPAGLQTVASVPVDSQSDYGRFLQYLWDVDVKTAPAPQPALNGHVPTAIRTRLRSLKVQPNERIVFSLMDGFMRHDAGYVHVGEALDSIRLARGKSGICTDGVTLALHLDGESVSADQRREAFRKSSQNTLSELTRNDDVSEARFALERAMLENQFAGLEILFSESSQAQLEVVTSHKLKQLKVRAELTPAGGTSLANDVRRIGKTVDTFAGVSRQGAALSCSFNFPANPALVTSLKNVVHCAKSPLREHLEQASDHGTDHKAGDTEFGEFVLDVADTAAAMTEYNGFVRVWSNGDGTLTTVGALRIGEGTRLQERIQGLKNQTTLIREIADTKVTIHKFPLPRWSREYAELFDQEGTVSVAVEKDCIWYALGHNAVGRLEQALLEAREKTEAISETAIELSAQLRPLGEVWNKIHSRRSVTTKKDSKKTREGRKPSVANWASIIADLNLPKIAAEAFLKGQDSMSVSLKREGDKASLSAEFDEGALRFIGKALSNFVKNNLN